MSEILTFHTGTAPDAPAGLHLIACTNTNARIGFDPFIEHNAEIIALRVQCEPLSSETNAREISIDLQPDSTEFILSNLIERTTYNATIYAIYFSFEKSISRQMNTVFSMKLPWYFESLIQLSYHKT
ncbi:unnamed protein product [Rotaria sp. Silwood1]|nr:unnamed protein product [Rotaria sp. Silwood1]